MAMPDGSHRPESSPMPTYQSFAAEVKRLDRAIRALRPLAAAAGVASPEGREWFELLRHKLLAQVDLPPLLVVAVVGGTNIGKSVVFNMLAGEVASASSPLAAGTKHPVCLAPPELADPALLARLFEPFDLHAWASADDPLGESPENRLFWRVGENVPARLLVLDAPDVDSDVTVNWRRATAIRQASDVLVAVLTQQKYNDAAVKQFFSTRPSRPTSRSSSCSTSASWRPDREYWPRWLDTFCEQTGARPELVYVVPYDRRAAEELRLPFSRLSPSLATGHWPLATSSLRDDLAALHFDAIKIRTFRGAMRRVLDAEEGLPAYLDSIRWAAADFAAAAAALETTEMARVGWPLLPAGVLVDEIRDWWDAGRQAWSRRIHGFYRTLGRGVTWPVRAAWDTVAGAVGRSDRPVSTTGTRGHHHGRREAVG